MEPHRIQRDDSYALSITRHATQRFCLRAYTLNRRSATRHLADAIRRIVEEEAFVRCTRDLYAAPLQAVTGKDLVALCAITGPPQKPITVAVITVLTAAMALASFSHLAGIVNPLSARLAA